MKLMLGTVALMASGAVAEAQKGEGGGGEGMKVGGMGVAGQSQLSIAGKVLDAMGNPLAGVEIEVTIEGISEIFDAKTKKKGKFNLLVPNVEAQYRAAAQLEGYRQINTEVAVAPDGKLQVEITMEVYSGPVEGAVPAERQTKIEPEVSEEHVAAVEAYNEAVRAMKAGDRETAKAKFAEAATIDPELENALDAQASLALEDKDYETLADASGKLLQLRPDDLQVVKMAYVANYMTGNAEGLATAARRLAELDPPVVEQDFIRNAKSGFDRGKVDLCRALMEVTVEARPDLVEAQLQLGMCCNAEGDSSCAREAFTTFLEMAPEHADAEIVRSLLDYLG
jgi:tetratricopeptide (TPR) repeat protein